MASTPDQQNADLALKAELSQRALEASMRERERLAADLHNGPLQDVFGLRLEILECLRLGTIPKAVGSEWAETTERVMKELRTLMSEIAPPNLEADGLRAALGELMERFETNHIATELDCDNDLPLDEQQRQLVYRIVQEGTRNIKKHARAQHVQLKIKKRRSRVEMELIDDGVGFSAQSGKEGRAEGYPNLNYLMQSASDGGANLDIRSAVGKGTTMLMTMPAVPPKANEGNPSKA